MRAERSLYRRYTTESALEGLDEKDALEKSRAYFSAHYSRLLPADKKSKIAEIGCGYGKNIKAMLEMGYSEVRGIDLSDEQVDYARNKLGLTNVCKADAALWLGDRPGTFDCLLAIDLLEHMETEELLDLGRKMYSALKPGGRLIVQAPNGMSPVNPIIYGDLTHVRAFTTKSMSQFFLHCGFVPVEYREIPPYVKGAARAFRRALWTFAFRPLIYLFAQVLHGGLAGRVFTGNFIAVAVRPLETHAAHQGGTA